MKKSNIVVVFLVAVLVLVTGIGFVSAKNQASDSMKYVGLKVYDPVYIAKEKGFFEKYGIEVEIVDTVAGGATAVQMVASGDVQGALLSTMAIINAVDNGMKIIGVADIQSAFNKAPLEEFFVRKDSGINTISDLKGKKIAINLVKSSFHYTWIMALEEAGISTEDVFFVSLPFDQQQAALERGDVDAIGLMQPYTKSARNSDKLRTLYTAVDAFGEKQFCEIFLNSEWANKNEKIASAFVSGIVDATEWVKNNQEESKQIISKYTGIDPQYIDDYYFQPNAMCIEDDAQYWLDFMQKVEGTSKDLSIDKIITNKYNKAVK